MYGRTHGLYVLYRHGVVPVAGRGAAYGTAGYGGVRVAVHLAVPGLTHTLVITLKLYLKIHQTTSRL